MKKYKVKEIYYTLQGEGYHSGVPAVFVRFAGCNLWNGREKDRSSAICKFCDTDFNGIDGINGGKYSAASLCEMVRSVQPLSKENKIMAVFTGGEPLLQLDISLIQALKKANIFIAIETNGTIEAPLNIDWICVSPKANASLIQKKGHELKLVYPQLENNPYDFEHLEFEHFYIQPCDDIIFGKKNIELSVEFVKNNPKWKLSLQTHKFIQIP